VRASQPPKRAEHSPGSTGRQEGASFASRSEPNDRSADRKAEWSCSPHWRFWAVVLGFFGCIWISLFVLNSDVLLVGLLVVFVVGAIFLRITGT
jgi:hypothetical protein